MQVLRSLGEAVGVKPDPHPAPDWTNAKVNASNTLLVPSQMYLFRPTTYRCLLSRYPGTAVGAGC